MAERYAASLMITQEALAQESILPMLRAALYRDLAEQGAEPVGDLEYLHLNETEVIARRWWEWLLRRPQQIKTHHLVRVTLYGERR